jgi:hypothetical protein
MWLQDLDLDDNDRLIIEGKASGGWLNDKQQTHACCSTASMKTVSRYQWITINTPLSVIWVFCCDKQCCPDPVHRMSPLGDLNLLWWEYMAV